MVKVPVPQGIETAIRKAREDASFKAELLNDRAKAAVAAGIELEPAEAEMLNTIPAEQLDAAIESSRGRLSGWRSRPVEWPPDRMVASRGIRPDLPIIGGNHPVMGWLLRILLLAVLVLAVFLVVSHWWP